MEKNPQDRRVRPSDDMAAGCSLRVQVFSSLPHVQPLSGRDDPASKQCGQHGTEEE
jgi:hypothetical protein